MFFSLFINKINNQILLYLYLSTLKSFFFKAQYIKHLLFNMVLCIARIAPTHLVDSNKIKF